MSTNTFKQTYSISQLERERLHKHKALLIWFTGLSGSGKSTLANLVEIELHKIGVSTFTLDGDNIRQGLNKDLSFTTDDRSENIRRIAEVANLMINSGVVVLAAFVSPFIKDRNEIRTIVGPKNYIEIFVNTSIEECEKRDVKGLYKKAREGKIKNLTGISSPYQAPLKPDLEIKTENEAVELSTNKILNYISEKIIHE